MNGAIPDAKQIFLEALDRESPEELLRYLDEACGNNAELRSRVEELLRAHGKVGNFLVPCQFPFGGYGCRYGESLWTML